MLGWSNRVFKVFVEGTWAAVLASTVVLYGNNTSWFIDVAGSGTVWGMLPAYFVYAW